MAMVTVAVRRRRSSDEILSTPGSHPFYEEADHYKNELSKKERDENLDATRFNNIWGK